MAVSRTAEPDVCWRQGPRERHALRTSSGSLAFWRRRKSCGRCWCRKRSPHRRKRPARLPFDALILQDQSSDSTVRFLLFFFVLPAVVFGGAVIVGPLAKSLRKVLEPLEDAGLSFPQAAADGLRRSLDFTGTASPVQFWSMLMLCGVLAVLALPMTALTVRRVRSMSWFEVLAICAVVVYIAADTFVL